MPIIDFSAAECQQDIPSDCEILIVGAGAAGLFLASKLSRHHGVVVIESGDADEIDDRQLLNEVANSAKPLKTAITGRRRAVGGTTIAWGGQSLPFNEIDFEKRDWVPGSGWPIKAGDLSKHYREANLAMGIDTLDYGEEVSRILRCDPPLFDSSIVEFHYSKWAPEPNFSKVFRRGIDRDFVILKNCHLLGMEISNKAVTAAELIALDHRKATLRAKHIIVAAGGLESARACLLLDQSHRIFTDSQRSRLGRGFMEHPSVYAGAVECASGWEFQRTFNTKIHRGRKYSRRLSASPVWQRENKLLNVTAAIMMKASEDAFDAYAEFRNFPKFLLRPHHSRAILNCALRTSWAYAVSRFVYKHNAVPHIGLCAEQDPSASSYVELAKSSEVDSFGVPKLKVNWTVSPLTWKTLVRYASAIKAEFARLSIGVLHIRKELLDENIPRPDILHDVAHHMGGTPMGDDCSVSIVDPDLRVRGLSNLWICSSSVFPTSSHSNPTLTILALANRLAEKLTALKRAATGQ
jgi:choline dehydrogenase-like flavoprotein